MKEKKGELLDVLNLASRYLATQQKVNLVETGGKIKKLYDYLEELIDRDCDNNSTKEKQNNKA